MSNPFKSKVPPANGGNYSEAPLAGTHQAVLVAILDLGTQDESFGNEPAKKVHKVFLAWELTKEKLSGMSRGHVIGKAYTLSYHPKSALSALIKGWRGKPLTEGEEFDLGILLGRHCMVSVTHSTNGDRTYAALAGVSSIEKDAVKAKATITSILWHIGCGENFPEAEWIPWSYGEKLADILARSEELRPKQQSNQPAGQPRQAEPAGVGGDPYEDQF